MRSHALSERAHALSERALVSHEGIDCGAAVRDRPKKNKARHVVVGDRYHWNSSRESQHAVWSESMHCGDSRGASSALATVHALYFFSYQEESLEVDLVSAAA
jgi:hypothetical protein